MLKAQLKALMPSVAIAIAAVVTLSSATQADPDSLAGTWSGGGPVTFASGSKERAKCRATLSASGPKSYRVSGTCATQSGKVTQTAEIYQMTANRYRGEFHNPEFDINGTISVVVSGKSMTATLTSSSGTGVLSFGR